MQQLNEHYVRLTGDFFRLYLNLEFISTETVLVRTMGRKRVNQILKALTRPVMLSEVGECAL